MDEAVGTITIQYSDGSEGSLVLDDDTLEEIEVTIEQKTGLRFNIRT